MMKAYSRSTRHTARCALRRILWEGLAALDIPLVRQQRTRNRRTHR